MRATSLPVSPSSRPDGPRVDPDRLEHPAVDVELNLVAGPVADSHRLRAAVARQLRQLALARVLRAVEAVEHLEPRLGQARGVHQPPEEGVRLVVVAEPQHRVERPARVAQPGEAVVPVAAAADPLRQRGGRRGDDRSRRREGEQLERQRAAGDGLRPGALVAEAPGPLRPEAPGELEPPLRVLATGDHGRLAGGAGQREHGALAGRQRELAADRTVVQLAVARAEETEHERLGPGLREPAARATLDARLRPAVVEARLEGPPQRDRPVECFDLPHQLAHRRDPPAVAERHRVRHAHAPLGGGEGRLEDVRIVEVAPLGLERGGRLEPERAAALGVQDPREHRRRVEVRQAEPVDRAVPGDQRGGPPVADERVLADRGVAVDALHRPGFWRSARSRRRRACGEIDTYSARNRHRQVRRNRVPSTSREAGFSPTLRVGVWVWAG